MGCLQTLTFTPGIKDTGGMDAAVFDSVDNFIIGIRGNRLSVCDPGTGAILSQLDVGTYARGNGCLAYDAPTNRIFAAAWNCPVWSLVGGIQESQRNLYRLHVNTASNPPVLVLDQALDVVTTFGQGVNSSASLMVGITAMEPQSAGGNIYCLVSTQLANNMGGCVAIKFSAANPAVFSVSNGGSGPTYNNIVYGSIGGHDNAILPDPESGPQVDLFDFTANTASPFNVTSPKVMRAVGFAPTQQRVFVTDVNQLIYVYTTAGVLVTTIDTAHSGFTGLAIRYDSTDGNVYVLGGNDNNVAMINPALNSLTMIPGFDCPVEYVRVGTKRFAVQAGATPLKSF